MAKKCTVPGGETITKGNTVCVTGFDTAKNRPTVKRATRDNLVTSKTIFGVAQDDAAGGSVSVLVAGEVAENAVTSLGAGNSRIIATNINHSDPNRQAELIRIDRPVGSEFVVGTCDQDGNLAVQPRASRDTSNLHVFNVKSYGAVGDFDFANPDAATDDLAAFQACLVAMKANGNRSAKMVADGHFYLCDVLDFHQAVVFEGTGRNEPSEGPGSLRSSPGTWLVFPKNVSGLRFHSGYELDGGADGSLVRNLTVYCKEVRPPNPIDPGLAPPPEPGQTGHGIWINCPVSCDQVHVENFGEHGFFIDAGVDPPATHGIAGGFQLTKCKSSANGKHGYYILGEDANAGLISCCEAQVNYGWGFFDDSIIGNTFVACHAEGNQGDPGGYDTDGRNHDYRTGDQGHNTSCFISCYTEASINHINFPASAIGGMLGEGSFGAASNGFAFSGGRASVGSMSYRYAYGTDGVEVEIGDPALPLKAISVARVQTVGKELITGNPTFLVYETTGLRDWWAWYDGSVYRCSLRFPTKVSGIRRAAPWCQNGIFLGDCNTVQSLHMASATIPKRQTDNTPATYEVGDIVWNSGPLAGGPIGQVCISKGTLTTLNAGNTHGSTTAASTTLRVDDVNGLARGEYITIEDELGVFQVMSDPADLVPAAPPAGTVEIYPSASVGVLGARISFSPAIFSTFGPVENVGNSVAYAASQNLVLTDRYVTVTIDGQTMILPGSPVDGQTHSIKSKAGVVPAVNTTVEGNGNTIDSAQTATVPPGKSATFRYSAAAGEWEVR